MNFSITRLFFLNQLLRRKINLCELTIRTYTHSIGYFYQNPDFKPWIKDFGYMNQSQICKC